MTIHTVKVYPSKSNLPKENQLAWKIAEIASTPFQLDDSAIEMLINRMIDNAGVAIAAINRTPVANARSQALCHPRQNGATIFGMPNNKLFEAEWSAWANGTAVRELDMHDTFLSADYSHPADNIPPILAVSQQCNRSAKDIIRGIIIGYEIQIALVKGICLHKHKIDHIAHLGPSSASGIGALLGLEIDTIYQAVQHALHVTCTTRQSRKGDISSWKAYAPAHAGKLSIESVDRAMRGERSPSPIYEGEDSVIAYLLDGTNGEYEVPLPEPGDQLSAILESYTKEHSAEYQSQALIDLAFRMRKRINNFDDISDITIYTSHHTHFVIGSGSGDPQKLDPSASRETLDHSIMYIFAIALQDGEWHHIRSYLPQRAQREDTVSLWHKIYTLEDAEWTALYHHTDPSKKAFGGRVVIQFKNGTSIEDEIKVANAHPSGEIPFKRKNYIKKFDALTEGIITYQERNRFLNLVQNLPELRNEQLRELNLQVELSKLDRNKRDHRGIF